MKRATLIAIISVAVQAVLPFVYLLTEVVGRHSIPIISYLCWRIHISQIVWAFLYFLSSIGLCFFFYSLYKRNTNK